MKNKTRLLGSFALLALAALVIAPAGATEPGLDLEAVGDFVFLQPAELMVHVDPMYLGAPAELWAEVEETQERHLVMSFPLFAPEFPISAPTFGVPGQTLAYECIADVPNQPGGITARIRLPIRWIED